MLKRAIGIASGVVIVLGWPVQALASQGFGVSPTSKEVAVAPGESARGEVTVINAGDTAVAYHLYAADYKVNGEDYKGDFNTSGAGPQVSPVTWLQLPVGNLVVKAGDQVKVPYTLTVPVKAAVGGHYGAVFAETVPPKAKGAAVVQRVERLASILYIAVSGELRRAGQVLPIKVPWLQTSPRVSGELRLRNTGNVHFAAEPTVTLATPFGKVGKPENLRGEVLPGTTRKFDIGMTPSAPVGLYKLAVQVKLLDRTETQSKWVVLMPYVTLWIIGGTLLLLVILGLVALIRRARRRRGAQ